MSKETKTEHTCSLCGRKSFAQSVLKENKDKKGFHCTNSKKCKEDQKGTLVNGQRKKKAAPKKGAKKK